MLKKEISQRIRGPIYKDKIKCYLAGPMEFSKDFGTSWRNELTEKLEKLTRADIWNSSGRISNL